MRGAAAAIVVAVIVGILIGQVVHFHHSGGTYGVSVGTNTYDCSFQNRGVSCEVAR